MLMARTDVISGIVLASFALLLHFVIIPLQVESTDGGPIALSPSLFCHITAFLLLVLSLNLIFIGFKDKNPTILSLTSKDFRTSVYRGATAALFSALYIVAIGIIGYFTSTVIFMLFFLYFSGVRSWKGAMLFLALILPFIYVLFVKALKVILPSGFWF